MDYNLFYSKTEYPYPSTTTSELDFVQHWVEQSVEKEIIRGKQLQQLKAITPTVKEYDVINVDCGRQPVCEPSGSQSANKPQKKKPKKRIHKSKKGKKGESVCTCRSPKSNRKKRKLKIQNCPMRIAELAVPTKRYCLNNWISNKNILPEIMIYRLQQIVRDQHPVVKISDAIICFKTHRSKGKRKTKQCEKKDKKCIEKNLKKAKNLSNARVFCAVFAYNISQILNKPMVLELSSELENLSKVVTMDIAYLLCKKHPDDKISKNKKSMLEEICNKITIWIRSILDDTYHLMLEEQLKELEEEIGPVLDIIDDLVDSVVDMCYVEPVFEEISSDISIDAEGQQGEEVDEEHDAESKIEIHLADSPTDLERLSDDIFTDVSNQIHSIINNIVDDDDRYSHTDLERLSDDRITDVSNQMHSTNYNIDSDNDSDNDSDKISLDLVEKSEHSVDDKEFVDADDNNEDNFPKPDIDPSEQIENQEERDDEGNQVSDDGKTFSQFNTVTDTTTNDIASSRNEEDNKVLHWKASIFNIVFSEPNEHLLSDADELWPKDIIYDEIVKSAVTINKSISSMGRINETEEKISIGLNENFFDANDSNDINENLDELVLDEVNIEEPLKHQLNNDLNQLYKDIAESKAVQTSIDKSNSVYSKKKIRDAGINTTSRSSITSRRKKVETVTSLSLADFSKKTTKTKPTYKVFPCTAPAWAMQGFYESSEGSSKEKQLNPCEIRKWCNDLQTGFNNLKLWSDWFDETSKMVTKLEQNTAKYCPNKRKQATKWMKLRKDIDDDADIWIKKHICTRKQFAKYKDLYRDNLVQKIICKCTK